MRLRVKHASSLLVIKDKDYTKMEQIKVIAMIVHHTLGVSINLQIVAIYAIIDNLLMKLVIVQIAPTSKNLFMYNQLDTIPRVLQDPVMI